MISDIQVYKIWYFFQLITLISWNLKRYVLIISWPSDNNILLICTPHNYQILIYIRFVHLCEHCVNKLRQNYYICYLLENDYDAKICLYTLRGRFQKHFADISSRKVKSLSLQASNCLALNNIASIVYCLLGQSNSFRVEQLFPNRVW